MTAPEYLRVRRYQTVLTAWSLLNDLVNDESPPAEIVKAWRTLQSWLAKEQEHFEAVVDTT